VIDIHEFNDEDALEPGHGGTLCWTQDGDETASIRWEISDLGGDVGVRLQYAVTKSSGDEHQINYLVPVEHTECNFGGTRPWFSCPGLAGEECGERVGKLYKPPRRNRFLCRHCYDLAYESRNRQGEFVYESVSKPLKRKKEAREQLEKEGPTPENLREYYEAVKTFKKGVRAVAGRWPPTPVEVEPLPPFEEWLEDLERRVSAELRGRDYGEHGQCEVTARTTGERCRQPATGDHGKCHYHGGAPGSGAPEGNQNAAADRRR